jgi:isopentenyl diphosphate isomerase/L-lactate dehydrogenase-like FMN-dependent dehydrogenase
MTLATLSTSSIEEAMGVATGPVWFQLYVFKDRDVTASLVQRAEKAGCKAIVLTVDVPVSRQHERDARSRFTLPDHLFMKNLFASRAPETSPKRCRSGAVHQSIREPGDGYPIAQDCAGILPRGVLPFLAWIEAFATRSESNQLTTL